VPIDSNHVGVGIFVVNRDGSGARQVASNTGVTDIRWLDPARIAFSAGPPASERYFIVDTQSRADPQEVQKGQTLHELDPRILFGNRSPDGEWVAFLTEQSTDAWNSKTGEVRQLATARATVLWAPTGHRVLLSWRGEVSVESITEIVDVDTFDRHRLPFVGISGKWLADAERIVYLGFSCDRGRAVGPTEVFVTSFDGTGVRDISAAGDEFEYEYAASPINSRVAYVSILTAPQLSWRLHIRDLDSDSRTALQFGQDPHIHGDAWSANGRYLRFWLGGSHGICN
jgi:hypothetical protein